ncbi:MAG: maf [Candidatus Taylorbacteria bacterium]|nr:maf [Candidatus Taylorbacteria bacterium]
MNSRKIILASASPRRKELLAKTGLQFEVIPGAYEEDMTLAMRPHELAEYLSHGKALSVAALHADAIVIGADTFIVLDDELLGKPKTADEAKATLRKLSGRSHSVLTGVSIIDSKSKKKMSWVSETKVHFRDLADDEIEKYVATGEPMDKAGAYAIQGGAAAFVEKIEGDYYCVMGLPLDELCKALTEEFGVLIKRIQD